MTGMGDSSQCYWIQPVNCKLLLILMKKAFFVILIILFRLTTSAQEIKSMKISELEAFIATRPNPAIINFWATWCMPCLEEMPWFNKIVHQNKNVELVFVSLDNNKAYPDKIRSFINAKKIKATLIWLNETNADVFCPRIDEQWGGSIPATLFIDHSRNYRRFAEGQLSPGELRKQLRLVSKK
jgi:thiol-disulfide isomerase/thioredoxin